MDNANASWPISRQEQEFANCGCVEYDRAKGRKLTRQERGRCFSIRKGYGPHRTGAEEALSKLYLERLRAADPKVAVKRTRLLFPDRDRTMYYLYLTTHDATGALAMNEVLWNARLAQPGLRWQRTQVAWIKRSRDAGQLTLFDAGMGLGTPPPSLEERREVDIGTLADHIRTMFHGRTATLLDVYRWFVDTDADDAFPGEVQRALTHLKRSGRVQYDRLAVHERLRFSP